MPRKTIASLEAIIAEQQALLEKQAQRLMEAEEHAAQQRYVPPNTYLSYQATGDPEVDAMLVVDRTIKSLQSQAARDRLVAWVQSRIEEEA
jgi:hypothetical protein